MPNLVIILYLMLVLEIGQKSKAGKSVKESI